MNDPSQMMPRSFGIWPPPPLPPPAAADGPIPFQAPPLGPFPGGGKPGRVNWKGKKAADKRKKAAAAAGTGGAPPAYRPPTLNELQHQNRMKSRRFYPKKKFARFAAPRNTTSFIIRAKKSGGIASLVSPCPVTPAILPTPKFSPSREGLVDMAKEEWGVDGYGSMKGLIRLRTETGMELVPGGGGEEEEMEDDGSSESDVEEHLEVERRLDHDLSRFEMVCPNYGEDHGAAAVYALENRVDDQDTHIAQLEEENLTLKERLFLVEQEMGDLRRRMLALEPRDANNRNHNHNHNHNNGDGEDNAANEEASEENEGGGDVCSEKSAGDCEEGNEAEAGTLMRE